MIPVTELARRMCEVDHPFLATTGAQIPCAMHITLARQSYGLLTNDRIWRVLDEARSGPRDVVCDHHDLPLVLDGPIAWHELVDPEGVEGTQRIPCPAFRAVKLDERTSIDGVPV